MSHLSLVVLSIVPLIVSDPPGEENVMFMFEAKRRLMNDRDVMLCLWIRRLPVDCIVSLPFHDCKEGVSRLKPPPLDSTEERSRVVTLFEMRVKVLLIDTSLGKEMVMSETYGIEVMFIYSADRRLGKEKDPAK